jgi:hypothetical protein
MVSLQKRPSFEASISMERGASPTYWPFTSMRAPVGCETIWTFSLGLTVGVCDAHPEQIRKTRAIRDRRMALERGKAGYMSVALSEKGAVRLAFCGRDGLSAPILLVLVVVLRPRPFLGWVVQANLPLAFSFQPLPSWQTASIPRWTRHLSWSVNIFW